MSTELPRFVNWCAASHGHDVVPSADGPLVRYTDAVACIRALDEAWEEWAGVTGDPEAVKKLKALYALRGRLRKEGVLE